MKKVNCLVACLTVLSVSQAFAATPYFGNVEPPKDAKKAMEPVSAPAPVIQQGGDTAGTATVIPGVPYADAGTTLGFVNDYTPTCATSNAPDVVYRYTPTTDQCVDISLCESGYDTMLYVTNAALVQLYCNDDADCDVALRSRIEGVNLTAGQTYYFIVDGWSGNAGEYILEVTECPPPCVVTCPPGAVLEGEQNCADGYVDNYNGGCNSTPNVFKDLVCDDTGVQVCGTYGTYLAPSGVQTRDTDWYRVVMTSPGVLTVCMNGEYPSAVAILNAICPPTAGDILDFQTGAPCDPFCATAAVPAGTYYIFAATNGFAGFPCGGDYVLDISGYNCPPVGVEAANWSSVKTLYR